LNPAGMASLMCSEAIVHPVDASRDPRPAGITAGGRTGEIDKLGLMAGIYRIMPSYEMCGIPRWIDRNEEWWRVMPGWL